MTSLYRGFTIDHDRNHAHAWRGKQEQREPDVIAQDLAGALHIIDVQLDDERRRADDPGCGGVGGEMENGVLTAQEVRALPRGKRVWVEITQQKAAEWKAVCIENEIDTNTEKPDGYFTMRKHGLHNDAGFWPVHEYDGIDVAETLKGLFDSTDEASASEPEPTHETKPITLAEVRAVLAQKSVYGHTAEIQALIRKYGAYKLSQVEPAHYTSLMAEAEAL